MTTDVERAIALARTTPLAKYAVAELGKKVAADTAAAAALAALDLAGVPAATVLAFVAAAGGAKLAPDLTRALLPEVVMLEHVGPLARATEGGALGAYVQLLQDRRGDLELEALVLLLAADEIASAGSAERDKIPSSLLTRARWLARHRLGDESSFYVGAAASRLGDADLVSLASRDVGRAKRSGKKSVEDALEAARSSPLEVLPESEEVRLFSAGFTVKHETPSVGRNDPCPCGSGKKYKKCHALEKPAPAPAGASAIDAARLGPDQAALLRPSEIASLDTARLSPKAFVRAFTRVVDGAQWRLALQMIGQAETVGVEATSLVVDALHRAYDLTTPRSQGSLVELQAKEAAEELHALLPESAAEREGFAMACLRGPKDLLARMEREAERALRRDADGTQGMLLAAALLRWFPALGIYVARGALHEARPNDSQILLEQIEDARDRLLLSPHEAWWDIYDAFFADPDETPTTQQRKDDAKREKLKEDLRRARATSRKTAVEMEKLRARVAELDDTLAGAPASAKRPNASQTTRDARKEGSETAVDLELAEERRRLKGKIDELVRIIGEGQEERRDLRRQIAERDERDERDERPPTSQRDDDGEDDADQAGEGDGPDADVARAIRVPRFSDRATKATTELHADAAEIVMTVVAGLASGRPNAWSGVKQLTKVRGVLSARAGIHHRVLFTVNDRFVDVADVLHRRDLEQTVARLARTGGAG
jgi:hypothetical protein